MPKLVDLHQDRNLIRNNFDGYKLSLESVPVIRQDVDIAPLKATPSDDQYSFLHAELFSMQNLLVSDSWERTSSYFVSQQLDVIKCSYDDETGKPRPMQPVFRIPVVKSRIPGDYRCSMKFVSEELAVVCDGIKQIYLLNTGNRSKTADWKKVFSSEISEGLRNFVLYDCRLDTIHENKVISCALVRIARDETSHSLHLHWARMQQEKDSWKFQIADVIEGKGSLYYCGFESHAESIIVSSNHPLKFRSKCVEAAADKDAGEGQVVNYSWFQTDDDITVKFDVNKDDSKNDYHVKCTKNTITVNRNDLCLLDKDLFSNIDQDLTTWSIENNFLQIILVKEDASIPWPYLVEGGPPETTDNKDSSGPLQENQPIPNLEAPIEDCDFPIGTSENEIKIERLNLAMKETTHQIILGNGPPLFSTSLIPGLPPALATREGVDASLWVQQHNPSKPTEWNFVHEGNLHAFGYVQASKQQKKFMDCAPNLSYAIICESFRHVFLYKTKNESADGLRNRTGPQISLGKQHLITLEDTGEVLGISTHSCVVTLLTEKCLLFLQVN